MKDRAKELRYSFGDVLEKMGDAGPTPAEIVGRWLMYLGLVALLGAALVGAVVTQGVRAISRRLVPAAWLVALEFLR